MIIDCHCHYGKGDGLMGPWDTKASLEKYLPQARKAGVIKTVLFSVFHSNYELANYEVAQVVAANPKHFYGFAFINPLRDAGRVFKMVNTAITKYNFCGIKVHRYDGRITREICETAEKFNLPVLYDVMGEVSVVELLAEEYPNVNFIIPHLGSFADDWKSQAAFCPQLVKHNNIYTDTSGVRRFDLLERALDEAGPDKILFGTDGPWLHPAVELSKIYALNLNTNDFRKVTALNFLRLTGNIKRGSVSGGLPFKAATTQNELNFKDPWIPN